MKRLLGLSFAAAMLARSDASAPPTGAETTRALARAELRAGEAEASIAHFREAIRMEEAAGALLVAAEDRLALSYTLATRARRFDEARAVLVFPWPAPEDLRARAAYYEGLIAYETGDLRAARALLSDAAERGARIGLAAERSDALAVLADTLAVVGRHAEAQATIEAAERALPEKPGPCKRAEMANNAGWVLLRADRGSPAALFEAAAELHRKECPHPAARSNALTNLVFANLARGRVDEARKALGPARPPDEKGFEREHASWLVASIGVALAEGAADEALQRAASLQAIGARSGSVELSFEAAGGRAEALLLLGRLPEAAAAFAEAGELLSSWARLVPLGEGRGGFLLRHDRAARAEVSGLFGAGRAEHAAVAARRSRRRRFEALARIEQPGALSEPDRARFTEALAAYVRAREALEARAADVAWMPVDQRPAAQETLVADRARSSTALDAALAALGEPSIEGAALPSLGPDEAALVVSPSLHGWISFLMTNHSTHGNHLGELDPTAPPAALASQLLAPFRAELGAASRVTVLASGAARRIDVHSLPFEGSPLGASRAVVYAADLPARPPRTSPAPLAVVVGDPRDDLLDARREALSVTHALEALGYRVEQLLGDAATHGALRALLSTGEVTLLHFAGHSRVAGRDGLQSGLGLALGTEMTVADVLSLERPPLRVVLSSCDGAREEDEGLSLAEAFLLSGTDVVVASPRPLPAEMDDLLWRVVYADKETFEGPPARLARALAAWPSLRVMVR